MSRFVVRACSVVLVLAAAGCSAAPASPGRAGPTTAAPASASVPTSAPPSAPIRMALYDAAGRVDALGTTRFGAVYNGAEATPDGVVVRRKPSAEFDAAVAALGLRVPVHLRDASYTARELRALTERIAADFSYWQQRGLVLSSVGPRGDGSGVEVGLPEPGDAARVLTAHYSGMPLITVVKEGPAVPL